MTIQTINPATGALIKSYDEMSSTEVNQIVDDVHAAHREWRKSDFAERKAQMLKMKALLEQRADDFANIITTEMGKPTTQAKGEVAKCIDLCQHYADNAEKYLAPREIKTEYSKSYVCYEALGVVFAIMPWNYPLWQVLRFVVPTLMNGNGGILSHAPISTGCAFMIEELVRDAGYIDNIFRTVVVSNDVAAEVVRNDKVTGVTLTGSERAGRAVASEAGKALKHVVMELGGSDPYLILADADIEHAAEMCVKSRLNNAGQICISAKRLIVVEEVREEFERLVIEKSKAFVPGDPTDPACTMGPMARDDLRHELHKQVQDSIAQGARLVTGGELTDGPGFYYPVTILADVGPGMVAFDKELFGPVISFLPVKDEAEAIRVANDSPFGLGGAVFTQDVKRGEHIARYELEAGTCVVNSLVSSNANLPFGGIGLSGYGRELSEEGIREFVNAKTICVK
tara:strand:- start:18071 stop:19438 length:1368 start_codon:yes stop_codon:yes gene_type:complete